MKGKSNHYEPAKLFRDWIQKGGKAQREFMETFASVMNDEPTPTFDPLSTLKEMADKAQQTQSTFMDNMSSMQNKTISNMLSFGQGFSNLLSYSAFKTTVGSNGRISIPEAERDSLGLEVGDLVQVIILPINKKQQ